MPTTRPLTRLLSLEGGEGGGGGKVRFGGLLRGEGPRHVSPRSAPASDHLSWQGHKSTERGGQWDGVGENRGREVRHPQEGSVR